MFWVNDFVHLNRKTGYTVRSTIDVLIVQTVLENKLMLLLTYLDGGAHGIKKRLMSMFERLYELDNWRVPYNDSDFTSIAKVIKNLKIF